MTSFDFSELSKSFDDSVVIGASNTTSDVKAFLSTGSLRLDWLLGNKAIKAGYPSGRMIEIFGQEAVGKSSMVTHAIVSAQRGRGTIVEWVKKEIGGITQYMPQASERKMMPGLGILIDTENKFPLDRAQQMGMNVDQLIRITSKKEKGKETSLTFEKCIIQLEDVLDKLNNIPYFQSPDVPVVLALDSLAAAPIQAELEGSGLQDGIAAKARKVRMAMRRLTAKLSSMNIYCIFTNQIYDRIGSPGSDTSGGRGLKFHASLRLQMKRAYPNGDIVAGGNVVGIKSTVNTVKSSYCIPPDKINIPIKFVNGIDQDLEVIDFFTENAPCDKAIAITPGWVKVTLPDGTEKSCRPGDFTAFLDAHEGSREHIMNIFERTIRGEVPEVLEEGETVSKKKKK